jgi:hypothetical protein
VSSNEVLTATDNILLISRLGLAEEVDGRDPTRPRRGMSSGPGLSSEVAVEEEDTSEEKECQQSERIAGVAPEEGHRVCGIL